MMMMENLWINQTSQPSSSSYTIMVISNWIEKFQNPPWKYSFMMVAGWSNRQTIQIKQTNDPDRKGQGRSFSFVRASSSKKKMLKTDERTKKISKNNDYVIQPYANHNMYRWYIEHTLYISGCVIFSNLFFLDSTTVKK